MTFTFRCNCGFVSHDIDGTDHTPLPGSCCNCGGQRCMGCVFREYDHECEHDCPDCGPLIRIYQQPPLERLATYVGLCCREWVLAAGFQVGRCGLCGQRPTFLRPRESDT